MNKKKIIILIGILLAISIGTYFIFFHKNTAKNLKIGKPDMITQEIIEPENIKGIKLIKDKNQLKLENSNLNLTKIIENYEFMEDNCLDLINFIEEYKKNENANFEENENEIILQVECQNSNNNTKFRKLILDKKTGNPTKMEIKDTSKKTTVYILYNEVKLNNIQESVIAFNHLL